MRVAAAVPDAVAAALAPLEAHGVELVRAADPAEALRHLDGRKLAVLVAGPDAELGAVAVLPPARRRRLVVVLAGPGVTTGDWLGAFVRGVNLTVGEGDLARLPQLVLAAAARQRELAALIEEEPLP